MLVGYERNEERETLQTTDRGPPTVDRRPSTVVRDDPPLGPLPVNVSVSQRERVKRERGRLNGEGGSGRGGTVKMTEPSKEVLSK